MSRPTFFTTMITILLFPLLTGCGTAQAIPADSAPSQGPVGPAGPPGMVYRNAYDPAVQYATSDSVTYERSTYIALASSTNIPPVGSSQSAARWALLAGAGESSVPGPIGPQGMQGLSGPQGKPGVPGPTGPTGLDGQPGQAGQDRTSFLAGKKFYVIGDSISSNKGWEKVVINRTGMAWSYVDAVSGRRLFQAFSCYGVNSAGGKLGTYLNAVPGCGKDGGVTGATLAENLSDTDLAIVDLGTNDGHEPIGQLGDDATSGTSVGTLRWIVETLETANPKIRVVIVTPQLNSLAPAATVKLLADAQAEYAASAGIPVVNMYRIGGVNATNLATLTLDGTHPTVWAIDNFYGPVIAQYLMQIF